MSVSAVTICSNALQKLGADSIASFDEGSVNANRCANLWPQTRDALLRSHPWNCCTKRVILAPDVTAPEFDYSYRFAQPADCLKILQVGEYGVEIDHRLENGYILADTNVLRLRYISKVEEPAEWDAMLVDLMTAKMKAELAYAVTQSASLAEQAVKEFEMAYRRAKAVDGQDDPPETLGDFRLLGARLSGGRRYFTR